jgi:hypothetical protein
MMVADRRWKGKFRCRVEVAGGMKKNLYPLVGAAMIGCGPVLSNIHVKLVSFIDKLDVVRLLRVLIIWLWYRDYIKL